VHFIGPSDKIEELREMARSLGLNQVSESIPWRKAFGSARIVSIDREKSEWIGARIRAGLRGSSFCEGHLFNDFRIDTAMR
jgi:hypothetical protein